MDIENGKMRLLNPNADEKSLKGMKIKDNLYL